MSYYDTILMSRTKTVIVSKTLNANNTSATVNLFKFNGTISLYKLYSVCTRKGTISSSALSNIKFDIYADPSASDLTGASGTISNVFVGSFLYKVGSTITTAPTLMSGGAGQISSSILSNIPINIINGKYSTTENYIRINYTTTDTPMDADFDFYIEYEPITPGANVVAV